MKGRDLITYILNNHLEDVDMFDGTGFLGFPTVDETAIKFRVGPATVRAWIARGYLKGVMFNGTMYILPNCVYEFEKIMEKYNA